VLQADIQGEQLINYKFFHLYLLALFPFSQHITMQKLPVSETLYVVMRCDSGKSRRKFKWQNVHETIVKSLCDVINYDL
jgi:hypothetical protein